MTEPQSPCHWCQWLPLFVIGLVVGATVLTLLVNRIPTPQSPGGVKINPTAGWVVFRDSKGGIQFHHPSTWSVDQTREYLNVLDEKRQLMISVEPNVNTAEQVNSTCSVFVEGRCEIAHYNSLIFEIDWGESEKASSSAFTRQTEKSGVRITLLAPSTENKSTFRNFLSKFVFLE